MLPALSWRDTMLLLLLSTYLSPPLCRYGLFFWLVGLENYRIRMMLRWLCVEQVQKMHFFSALSWQDTALLGPLSACRLPSPCKDIPDGRLVGLGVFTYIQYLGSCVPSRSNGGMRGFPALCWQDTALLLLLSTFRSPPATTALTL